ncbi:MAG: hypothetical protein WDW36_006157 [Sanguina aurantia]
MSEQRMGRGFGSGPSQTSTPASSYAVNSTAPASGVWQTAATSAAAAKDLAVGAVGTATDVARQAATTTAAAARSAAGTAMGAASMVGSAAGTVRDTTGKAAGLVVQGTQAVSGATGAAADLAYEVVKVPVGLAGDAASLAVHTTGGLMRSVLLSPLWLTQTAWRAMSAMLLPFFGGLLAALNYAGAVADSVYRHLDTVLHYANKKLQAVIDNTPGVVHNAETQLQASGSVSRISLPNSDDGLPGAMSQVSPGKDLTDQGVVIVPVEPTTFSALRPSLELAPAEAPAGAVSGQERSPDGASAAVHTADDTLRQAGRLTAPDPSLPQVRLLAQRMSHLLRLQLVSLSVLRMLATGFGKWLLTSLFHLLAAMALVTVMFWASAISSVGASLARLISFAVGKFEALQRTLLHMRTEWGSFCMDNLDWAISLLRPYLETPPAAAASQLHHATSGEVVLGKAGITLDPAASGNLRSAGLDLSQTGTPVDLTGPTHLGRRLSGSGLSGPGLPGPAAGASVGQAGSNLGQAGTTASGRAGQAAGFNVGQTGAPPDRTGGAVPDLGQRPGMASPASVASPPAAAAGAAGRAKTATLDGLLAFRDGLASFVLPPHEQPGGIWGESGVSNASAAAAAAAAALHTGAPLTTATDAAQAGSLEESSRMDPSARPLAAPSESEYLASASSAYQKTHRLGGMFWTLLDESVAQAELWTNKYHITIPFLHTFRTVLDRVSGNSSGALNAGNNNNGITIEELASEHRVPPQLEGFGSGRDAVRELAGQQGSYTVIS